MFPTSVRLASLASLSTAARPALFHSSTAVGRTGVFKPGPGRLEDVDDMTEETRRAAERLEQELIAHKQQRWSQHLATDSESDVKADRDETGDHEAGHTVKTFEEQKRKETVVTK